MLDLEGISLIDNTGTGSNPGLWRKWVAYDNNIKGIIRDVKLSTAPNARPAGAGMLTVENNFNVSIPAGSQY